MTNFAAPGVWELIRGPQDGAKVKALGKAMPLVIYVGPKPLGDGFAAWGIKRSRRFPAAYQFDGMAYVFLPPKKR